MSESTKIRGELGATLLEFSLAFGVFLMMVLGTLEFARFMAIRAIQVKATQAALAEMQRSEVMQTDLSKCGYSGTDPILLAEKNNCLNFVPMFEARRDAIAARAASILTSAFISMPGSGGNAELVEFRHSYPASSAGQVSLPVGFVRQGDVVVDADKNIPAAYGFPSPSGSGTWQGKLNNMPFMVVTRVKVQPIIRWPFLPAVMDVAPSQAFGYAELPKTTRIPPDLALPFPPAPPTTTLPTPTPTATTGSCNCGPGVGVDPTCDPITGAGSSCDGCNCSAPPPLCPGQQDCGGWCCALTDTCGASAPTCNPGATPTATATATAAPTPTATVALPSCVCPASTTCNGTDVCQSGGCAVSGGDDGLCVPGACAGYNCNGGSCVAPGGVPSCDCTGVPCSGSLDSVCNCTPDPCNPNPCNGGTCSNSGGVAVCSCSGVSCAGTMDPTDCSCDPCNPDPCNGGTCTNNGGAASCSNCPTCAVPLGSMCECDGCMGNPCGAGTCTDLGGGNHTCDCSSVNCGGQFPLGDCSCPCDATSCGCGNGMTTCTQCNMGTCTCTGICQP